MMAIIFRHLFVAKQFFNAKKMWLLHYLIPKEEGGNGIFRPQLDSWKRQGLVSIFWQRILNSTIPSPTQVKMVEGVGGGVVRKPKSNFYPFTACYSMSHLKWGVILLPPSPLQNSHFHMRRPSIPFQQFLIYKSKLQTYKYKSHYT